MDFLFIDARDPIFGLIILVLSVVVVVIFSYFWGMFSRKSKDAHIDKFLAKFSQDDNKIIESLSSLESPELAVIAKGFAKLGDWQKAANFYEKAIKKAGHDEKMLLLGDLGLAYIKTGLLKNAKDCLEELLGAKPRDEKALFHLLFVYEKLKDKAGIKSCLDALFALGCCDDDLRAYIGASELLSAPLGTQDKITALKTLPQTALVKRYICELKSKNYEKPSADELPPLQMCADLFDLDTLSEFWSEFFTDEQNGCENLSFSIKLAKLAKENNLGAKLEFKYTCLACKNELPLFFARCPKCLKIASVKLDATLRQDESFSQQKGDM